LYIYFLYFSYLYVYCSRIAKRPCSSSFGWYMVLMYKKKLLYLPTQLFVNNNISWLKLIRESQRIKSSSVHQFLQRQLSVYTLWTLLIRPKLWYNSRIAGSARRIILFRPLNDKHLPTKKLLLYGHLAIRVNCINNHFFFYYRPKIALYGLYMLYYRQFVKISII